MPNGGRLGCRLVSQKEEIISQFPEHLLTVSQSVLPRTSQFSRFLLDLADLFFTFLSCWISESSFLKTECGQVIRNITLWFFRN